MELDLASLASVRSFCDAWDKRNAPIDILVNNAGVFAMGGNSDTHTASRPALSSLNGRYQCQIESTGLSFPPAAEVDR
jgi:NAD(P)-dependent dehydrogenase (short-subunit alcohol dehydrogenase family)